MSRMALETAIRLSAEVKGGANITKVQRSLQDLAKGSQITARDMDALRSATAQYARASDGTIAGLRNSIAAFRGLQEQVKIGSREFQRYGSEVQRLEAKLKGLDGAARAANPALNGLGAAAVRLIAAYAGIETVRFVFGNTAELEAQTRSLEVLTGSADRAKQIVQELQQLGAVTPFTSTELIDTAKRLQAFGVETENVVDITRRLADVSGATGAELAGLATAYGQVQAKGRLQGEELLQFQERGVALQQVLRKEYGLSGAEFQKALEGGKISAEAVEYALKKLTDTGGKYANGAIAQSDTLNGRLSTLQDSIQVLAQTVGKKLEPGFKKALNVAISLTGQIQQMISLMDDLGGQRRELDWQKEADLATDRFAKQAGWNPLVEQGKRYEFRQLYMAQKRADYALSQQTARASTPVPTASAPPPLSGSGAGGGGGGGAAAGAKGQSPAAQIATALKSALGLTDAQAAGIVGNLMRESGLNPRVNEGGAVGLPRGVGGYGTAQWTGSRQQDLVRFAGGAAGAGNLQTQLRFMVSELMGPESKALASLRKATTPEDAAVSFDRNYLSSGIKALPERKANARRVYNEIAGSGPGAGLDDFAGQLKAQAQAAETMREQQQAAKDLLATEGNRLQLLKIADPMQRQVAESMVKQLTIMDEYGKRLSQVTSGEVTKTLQLAQQNALQANGLELERSITDIREDGLKPLNDAVTEYRNRLAYEHEYGGLLEKSINPELARQYIEIDRIAAASKTALELQIAKLEVLAAELPIGDKIREGLEKQIALSRKALKLVPGAASGAKDDAKKTDDTRSKREKQEEEAKTSAERIKDLYKGIAGTIRDGIVDAMQAGIDSLIDGSKRLDESLKEIASGVLKEISNVLLRFAVNAAAKGLFPTLFADGGVFGFGGGEVTAFANGGIVNEPTMFKFANGGTMRNGLLGEAGPEAIMPLRRGADGRLGVDASGMVVPYQASPAAKVEGDAATPYQGASTAGAAGDLAVPFRGSPTGGAAGDLAVPFRGSPTGGAAGEPATHHQPAAGAAAGDLAVPFQSSGPALSVPFLKTAGGASGDGTLASIDVKFETVRIGNMDVVTREEAQRIGQEAAQRGAELAQKRLRNNPSARRAAGIR